MTPVAEAPFDAVVVVSFGGPEGPEDVMPFLEKVTGGRNIPAERLREVASHYLRFGGVSPINSQNRQFITALDGELKRHGIDLPVYFGNRNWHPFLADTVATMAADGVRRALAFVTSAYGSYSGCRQYQEDIAAARAAVGSGAPEIEKIRLFYNHPGFVEANVEGVRQALCRAGDDPLVLFSAHSIPVAMAAGSPYVEQLEQTATLVATAVGNPRWELVYQSRSGPPEQPWLGPDIVGRLRLAGADARRDAETSVVAAPIGFVSDHMEVLHDLDVEAADAAEELGIRFLRAPTAGTHPRYVNMARELIEERLDPGLPRLAIGRMPPWSDHCPGCCPPPPPRRPERAEPPPHRP